MATERACLGFVRLLEGADLVVSLQLTSLEAFQRVHQRGELELRLFGAATELVDLCVHALQRIARVRAAHLLLRHLRAQRSHSAEELELRLAPIRVATPHSAFVLDLCSHNRQQPEYQSDTSITRTRT